jgi:hypothetical protein
MDPPENCSAAPKGDNLYEWESTITGPPNSPYTGGRFQIDISFPTAFKRSRTSPSLKKRLSGRPLISVITQLVSESPSHVCARGASP